MLYDFLKGKDLRVFKKIDKQFMENLINVKISQGRIKCLMLPVNTLNNILNI